MKRILSFVFAITLILSFCACDGGDPSANPHTITDAFDGARKVWYWTTDTDIWEDSKIRMVIVSENKNIINAFYKFEADEDLIFESTPNPFADGQLTMRDVVGKTDDEVISMVASKYADITQEYTGKLGEEEYTFSKSKLPYKMTYSGRLNTADEDVKYESLNFHGEPLQVTSKLSAEIIDNEFKIEGVTDSTKIINTEFIGFKNENHALITINIFDSFEVDFDSADHAEYAF